MLAVVVGVPLAAPAPVRAADGPKVVIVVGATHSATSTYRKRADEAYAEAIKHTPNVVKVYSPNATWSAVKAAAKGASILIYFGHGNGWPSPYTYDPEYTTKDGFGLNATAGNGDYNNKYYGEPYAAQLELAENALVMLHHLCYASGNSEPGYAEPSVSTARKRIDNYGAGFLRSPARAVLADGHRGPTEYLRAIFTTNQTIESVWRNVSSANGNVTSFAGTRSAGATALMDPETPTSGFYRSLIGDPSLATNEITGGFVVPGRAAPRADGAPLYAEAPASTATAATTQPASLLPASTRLTILETVSGSGDDAIFHVEGLDDPSIAGYMLARDLESRDSLPPTLTSVVGGGGKAYSTVATGLHRLAGTLDESAAWTVRITRGDTTYLTKSGTGSTFDVRFDPAAAAGDGEYRFVVVATDEWSNGPMSKSGTFVIDTAGPTGTAAIDGGAATALVGTVRVGLEATDALSSVAKVRLANSGELDAAGLLATGTTYTATSRVAWTLAVGAGARTVHVQWQDAAGNWSPVVTDSITVDPPDTTYRTITPVRLLDTRSGNPSGATKLSHAKPMSFAIAGRGGVPDDAIAITGNLTVTGQTAAGYVTLGPIVGTDPATSTINVPKGDTRANGVIVPLDRAGKLEAVYRATSGHATHLVLDVTGYFVAGDGGSRYQPLAPGRFLDTRAAGGPTGGAALAPSTPVAIKIGGRAVGSTSVPADAVAVTGNLTVTDQTAGGYLSLTPTAQADPATSTLNFPTGDTRANGVTVPLGSDGRAWAVYKGAGRAHAILDVTGYFRAGGDGLTWVPLAPARILDSRADLGKTDAFAAGSPGSVAARGRGGLGSDAQALTANLTVVKQTRGGYASMTPTPTSSPSTSTINFPTGDVRANGVVSKLDTSTGKVGLVYMASSGATTHLIIDVTGYFH